jgi:hypothetical protein
MSEDTRDHDPPGQPLADLATLREYLRAELGDIKLRANGLRLTDPPIEIEWVPEHRQVRFFTHLQIKVPPDRRADVAAAVARGNELAGRTVWRTEPELTAEVVERTDADGAVWTREVDRAIAILRTSVARDAQALRRAAGA